MTQVISKLTQGGGKQQFNRLAVASSSAALLYWAYLIITKNQRRNQLDASSKQDAKIIAKKLQASTSRRKRPDFNKTLRNLRIILKSIMGYQDILLCSGVTLGLVFRTLLDLWNIQVSTQVESAIITANTDQLKSTLISFIVQTPTLAFVNNIIKYFTDKLSLRLRYNLSRKLYEKYMTDLTYYHLSQSNTQNEATSNGNQQQLVPAAGKSDHDEFKNVDQLLTADVDKFASSIVEVYNNLSKPILDIILLVHRMSSSYTGGNTPAIMIGWLAIVGTILTQARKPLSKHIIRETQCEGQLRFVHSRLIQNNEEIAFFRGNQKEKLTLMNALDELRDALDQLILFKFKIGFMDNIVGRYSSTVVGYLALAMPFFSARYADRTSEERLNLYYVSGRMMMKLAESITRVILAGQDLTKLAAYTQRVNSLIESMDRIQANSSESSPASGAQQRAVVEICDRDNPLIDFKNVTLSTPQGDILVRDLTITIKPKQSVIITGPNGSGKSSLFRVLGNLWRFESGTLIRPPREQLFYICQKPYMTLGSLRSQIIFPDTKAKCTDQQLNEILEVVELKYLLDRDRENLDLDTVNDWQDVLSGGEKQRMALARLIYHKPKFAILDECTSAVAIDVEQRIYKYLSEHLGCTLLSVSHRVKQLAKFHHLILEFDGNGSYEFRRLNAPI